MGIDYSAVTIIGMEYAMPDRVFTQRVVASCEHPERHGQKFCPKCGTKVADRVVKLWDEFFEIREGIEEELPRNYQFHWKEDSETFVLGYGASVDWHDSDAHTILPLKDPVDIAGEIRRLLEEAGIPDAKAIGTGVKLHCIMDAR